MTLWAWMKMSMFFDISFLIFACATIWKSNKYQNKFEMLNKKINSIQEQSTKLNKNILLVAKNPKDAKRLLKEKE
mgnify:CR=1 FL=1